MSDPIIGALVTQLGAILEQQIREEIRLVRGVKNDVRNLEATFDSIQAVILDAEKKQVKEANVRLWLQRLRDALYDIDDVLAEWSAALFKVQMERLENNSSKEKVFSCITSLCFCFGKIIQLHDIALKIKELNKRLYQIANEKQKYSLTSTSSNSEVTDVDKLNTTSYVEASEVHGRDVDKTNLIGKLLKGSSQSGGNVRLNLISLVGMGGIGKTTLAGLAYHSPMVKDHFEMRMWAVVSEPFDVMRIAKSIVEDIERTPSELSQLEPLLRHLRESIENKKYLLVLDDAWTDNPRKWEPLISSLNVGATGSTILITTRNERVAKSMRCNDMLHLHVLSDEECWNLFSQHAFSGRSMENLKHLEPIGKKIANKCKGLPLAAKAIGSLMRFKDTVEEWQHVLGSEMWELEKEEEAGLFPPLLLSYYALRPALRRCFSYCAIFPKDCWIKPDNLIQLWMAQGYLNPKQDSNMEVIGIQYLKELASRCFFQELRLNHITDKIKKFKMHDMVHDLALYLTQNEYSMMEVDSEIEGNRNPSLTAIRHLTLVRLQDMSFPTFIGNTTKLRTLWVKPFIEDSRRGEVDKLSADFFQNLLNLKVLDIGCNRFQQLPEEMGISFNLRYLNLSKNPLIELPDKICELYNLQTLKLNSCRDLERLPPRIGKLNNLRHLEIDHTYSLKKLPKEIGKLCRLQRLTKFVLSRDMDDEETRCNLGDLKDLNQLQGSLQLKGLGYVTKVADVLKAELNKKKLIEVSMDFKPFLPTFNPTAEVLEALELHQDVRNLTISRYRGAQFPSWIFSLNNLRYLSLYDWQNCIPLPPLGKLQCLKTLWIRNMDGLKRIGEEFLGVENDGNGGKEANIVLFPNLEMLVFEGMLSWEEWSVTNAAREVEGGSLKIMPCLTYLHLIDCNRLEKMPEILLEKTPIRELHIRRCPGLHRKYGNRSHDQWPKSHVQQVFFEKKSEERLRKTYKKNIHYVLRAELNKKQLMEVIMEFHTFPPMSNPTEEALEALELHQYVQGLSIRSYGGAQFPSWIFSLNNLRFLQLLVCQNCIHLPPLGKLQSLETLWINDMDGLKRIGEEFLGVESNCNGGKEVNVVLFPNLDELIVRRMTSLEEWSVINAVSEVEGGSLKIMPGLRTLKLEHCMKLEKLPEVLLEKTSIKYLSIHNCPGLSQKYGNNTTDQWPNLRVQEVRIEL